MADDSDLGEGYVAFWTGGPKATINGLNDMVKQGNDHEDRISALENALDASGGDGGIIQPGPGGKDKPTPYPKNSPYILNICMNGVPAKLQVSGMIIDT